MLTGSRLEVHGESVCTNPGVVQVVVKQRARLVAAQHLVGLGYRLVYRCGILGLALVGMLSKGNLAVCL